jgi:hypothetical protein
MLSFFLHFGYPQGYAIMKGKATPMQARTGHEGSRKLRLPDYKTIGT